MSNKEDESNMEVEERVEEKSSLVSSQDHTYMEHSSVPSGGDTENNTVDEDQSIEDIGKLLNNEIAELNEKSIGVNGEADPMVDTNEAKDHMTSVSDTVDEEGNKRKYAVTEVPSEKVDHNGHTNDSHVEHDTTDEVDNKGHTNDKPSEHDATDEVDSGSAVDPSLEGNKNVNNTEQKSFATNTEHDESDSASECDSKTQEGEENGIPIEEKDIIKATDVYGRGKRQRVEKVDDLYDSSDEKIMVATPKWSPSKVPKIEPRRYKMGKVDKEDVLLPADYGWKRELVIRNVFEQFTNSGHPKHRPMDVYYHPPHGKKLRSMKQLLEFLKQTKSPLAEHNFSFIRQPISEPPFEIVRNAGEPKCKRASTLPQVVIERDVSDEEENKGDENNTAVLKPQLANTGPKIIKTKPRRLSLPSARGRPRKLTSPLVKKRKVEMLVMDDPGLPLDMLSPDQIKTEPVQAEGETARVEGPPVKKKFKSTARKSTTQKSFKQKSISPGFQGTENLCTLNCPGQENIHPSLHCSVCLCLFHPECVNFHADLGATFTCLRCISALSTTTASKGSTTLKTVQAPTILAALQLEKNTKTMSPPVNKSASPPVIVKLGAVKQEQDAASQRILFAANKTIQETNSLLMDRLRTSIMDKQEMKNDGSRVAALLSSQQSTVSVLNSLTPSVPGLTVLSSAVNNSQSLGNTPLLSSSPHILKTNTNGKTVLVPLGQLQGAQVRSPGLQQIISPSSGLPFSPIPVQSPRAAPPLLTPAPGTSPKLTPVSSPSSVKSTPSTPKPEQKNGQILTLPTAVAKRLNLQQPLSLKINNVSLTVPPSSLLFTADGLKLFLPPNTFPVSLGETAKLSVTVTNDKSTSNQPHISINMLSDTKAGTDKSPAKTTETKETGRKTRHFKTGINPAMCFFRKLYGGFDCMFCIFRYLDTKDLLQASRVCKTWKQISMYPSLWQRVRLNGLKICHWDLALKFFNRWSVQSVDLRGILHEGDGSSTWHNLLDCLHKVTSVKKLRFGLVPGSVIHAVSERLPSLESLTAEWITDYSNDQMWTVPTKIDLGKLSDMKSLMELRLRGVAGLTMPSFSFTGGINDLSNLTSLTVLSLTTLKEKENKDYSFLTSLKSLEVLELGDCSTWSSETYSHLNKLSNLKSLRLECGGDIGLEIALSGMKQLEKLELIMFVVDESLKNSLNELSQLKSMVIWPDTSTLPACLVNSHAYAVVSKLPSLQRLEWGILACKNSSIILDTNENKSKCGNSEWIPLLSDGVPSDGTVIPTNVKPVYTNIQKFTEMLSTELPRTKLKVFSTEMLTAEKALNKKAE